MSNNIINFQQRRELEEAIADLAHARNELELTEAARQIVHIYPISAVLAALLKHLDTTNSQVRGGLGHVATLLPQETVTEALRTFVGNRQHTPLARMSGVAIAERFLGVTFPAALTADLQDTDDAAFQSLLDAIEQGKRNRHVLLEYVQQMRELDEEIAFLVLDALTRIQAINRVELLRLLAQDGRPRVAQAALAALEQVAATTGAIHALRALHTLQYLLPAELATIAERALRKLSMAGKRYHPPSTEHWRALLSPAEPNGNQTVWLAKMSADKSVDAADGSTDRIPTDTGQLGILLGFTVNLNVGIVRFFGSEHIENSVLPPIRPSGALLTIEDDGGGTAIVLEAPFDYGRWLVGEAYRIHLAAPTPNPLPEEFQLYNDHVWQFAVPQVDPAVQAYWRDPDIADIAADKAIDYAQLGAITTTLFANPVMEEWTLPARALIQATPPAARPTPGLPLAEATRALLREISRWPESEALPAALAQGLRGQAAWLHLAGQVELAAQAHRLATAMPHLPLAQNPVLAHLLAVSLESGVRSRGS